MSRLTDEQYSEFVKEHAKPNTFSRGLVKVLLHVFEVGMLGTVLASLVIPWSGAIQNTMASLYIVMMMASLIFVFVLVFSLLAMSTSKISIKDRHSLVISLCTLVNSTTGTFYWSKFGVYRLAYIMIYAYGSWYWTQGIHTLYVILYPLFILLLHSAHRDAVNELGLRPTGDKHDAA